MNLWREWRRRDESVDPIIQEPRPLQPISYERPRSPRRRSSPELGNRERLHSPRARPRGETPVSDAPQGSPPQRGTSRSTDPNARSPRANSPDFNRHRRPSSPLQRRHRGSKERDPNQNAPREGYHVTALPGQGPRQGNPERRHGDPERRHGDPERRHGDPERRYGDPERRYGDPEGRHGDPQRRYGDPESRRVNTEPQKVGPDSRYVKPEQWEARPEPQKNEPEPRNPFLRRSWSNPKTWVRGEGSAQPKQHSFVSGVELPGPDPVVVGAEPGSPNLDSQRKRSGTETRGRGGRFVDRHVRQAESGSKELRGSEPRSPVARKPRRLDSLPWPREREPVKKPVNFAVAPLPASPVGDAMSERERVASPQNPSNPSSPRRFVSPKYWRRGDEPDSTVPVAADSERTGASPGATSPRRAGSPKPFKLPKALGRGGLGRGGDGSSDILKSKLKAQKKKDKKLFSKRYDRPDGCCNCCGFCTHALALVLILCGNVAVAIATVFYFYAFGIALVIGLLATIGWIWVTADMMLGRRGGAAQGFYTCCGLLHSVGIIAVAAVTGLLYFAVLTPGNDNGFAPSTYLSLALFFWALPVPYLCGICFDCVGTRQLLKWSAEKEMFEDV